MRDAPFTHVRDIFACKDYRVAVLDDDMIGVTWNDRRPSGDAPFPIVRGQQGWFILPEPIAHMVRGLEGIIKWV